MATKKPLYLDIFWDYMFGRPFGTSGSDGYTGTQGSGTTTLNSSAALNVTSLVCASGGAASAGFVQGEPIIVGTPGATDWQRFVIQSIASDTLNIFPRVKTVISPGATIGHMWNNTTHIGANAYQADSVASWLANKLRAGTTANRSLLPPRIAQRYTDGNGEVNVPHGWVTGRTTASDGSGAWIAPANGSEITASTAGYVSTSITPHSSDSLAFAIITNTTAYQGLKTLTPISVVPGTKLCLEWTAKLVANTSQWSICNADTNTLITASTVMGSGGLYELHGQLGIKKQLIFTVPAGCYNIDLRLINNYAAGTVYIDTYRLFEVPSTEIGGLVFSSDYPRLTLLGDSWGVQIGDALTTALAVNGVTVTNNSTSGQRIDQLVDNFAINVPATSDACLLMASTNDVAQGATATQLIERVGDFIDQCEALNILPIIMGVPALSIDGTYTLTNSNTLNNALRRYVLSRAAPEEGSVTNNDVIDLLNQIVARTNLIGSGTAFITSPVSGTTIQSPLIIGSNYLSSLDNAFEFDFIPPAGATIGSSSCQFGGKNVEGNETWNVAGSLSNNGDGTWRATFELEDTVTETLVEGFYNWSVEFSDGTDAKTIARGTRVKWAVKYTS